MRTTHLLDLFAADANRVEALTFNAPTPSPTLKQRIDGAALCTLGDLASAADFDGWRTKLFGGEIVNTTENRAAKHWSLRITDPPGGSNDITRVLDRMHASPTRSQRAVTSMQ